MIQGKYMQCSKIALVFGKVKGFHRIIQNSETHVMCSSKIGLSS